MTKFLEDEMTLKTTLMVWEPMVTSNGLVSQVISLIEKFLPSMPSTSTSVFFSARVYLYFCTSFLSIKHADAPKSRSDWASIITSLIHLTMISIKKHVLGLKINSDHCHYMMHQGPTSLYLLRFNMLVFDSFSCGLIREMAHVACGPYFFRHSQTI